MQGDDRNTANGLLTRRRSGHGLILLTVFVLTMCALMVTTAGAQVRLRQWPEPLPDSFDTFANRCTGRYSLTVGAPRYQQLPPVTYSQATRQDSNSLLTLRRKMQDPPGGTPVIAATASKDFNLQSFSADLNPPLEPTAKSDAIVVARAASRHTYLSENQAAVFTLTTLRVEEALKVKPGDPVKAGANIDLEEDGGAVGLPDGRTFRRSTLDVAPLFVPGQYILFLRYRPASNAYSMLSGFYLRGGRAYWLSHPVWWTHDPKPGRHYLMEYCKGESGLLTDVLGHPDNDSRGGGH